MNRAEYLTGGRITDTCFGVLAAGLEAGDRYQEAKSQLPVMSGFRLRFRYTDTTLSSGAAYGIRRLPILNRFFVSVPHKFRRSLRSIPQIISPMVGFLADDNVTNPAANSGDRIA
jgi:hypothetical protein